MSNYDVKVINNQPLDNVLTQLKTDAVLRNEFYNAPVPVLQRMGVAMNALQVRKSNFATRTIEDVLTQPAGAWQICVTVGEIIGASIGWTPDK